MRGKGPSLAVEIPGEVRDNLTRLHRTEKLFLNLVKARRSEMYFLGESCESGEQVAVDLDAGKSSLRYSGGEWLLNWQTGQSLLDTTGDGVGDSGLLAGCYELNIPRVSGTVDTRLFILQ